MNVLLGIALPFQMEWLQYNFMQNALLAILIMMPLFALIGTVVISNQMAFFSDAIGHATLTGIAIGVLLGLGDPLWAMIIFAIGLALLVSVLRRYGAVSPDTVIGIVMAFSVSLGIVLLSRHGGFARYTRYLIGNVLTIAPSEIVRLAVLLAVVVGLWVFLFNRIFFVCWNRPLARSRGVPVWIVETFFSVLVAVVVTVTIPWVGLLVINSMLILPAAASRNLARDIPHYISLAVLISLCSGVIGLWLSYYWNTSSGATIVLVAMGFYLISLPFRNR